MKKLLTAAYATGVMMCVHGAATAGLCDPDWVPTFLGNAEIDDRVLAFAVFDDGAGPALYVGGRFETAGGVAVNHIAKWDGESWTALGDGLNDAVEALVVFDDGDGPALYAGGWFNRADDLWVHHVAKWDGESWSSVGGGVSNAVARRIEAMAVYDDGSGPALYVGGRFETAGGVSAHNIAKWNGKNWSPLGSGMRTTYPDSPPVVSALAVFDDVLGPALFAGGYFKTAGGDFISHLARWDGAQWSALGDGVNEAVRALAVYDSGSIVGPRLFVGGGFSEAGGVEARGVAAWKNGAWTAVGGGLGDVSSPSVHALAVFDDGSGPGLYAGGWFSTAGGIDASRIARWDGQAWAPLGAGFTGWVYAMIEYDSGDGPALYTGGNFFGSPTGEPYLARWRGGLPVAGDLNGDRIVNATDLSVLLGSWGNCPPAPLNCIADQTGSGLVGAADLAILLANWGASCP